MKLNRKITALILCGMAVVAVAVFAKTAIPLYDGVGFPDEPYRFADPAHNPKTKPPGAPSLVFLKSDAQHGISVQSNEVGPQVVIYISPSSISLSPDVSQAKLTVQPIKPMMQPSDGKIAGNVYRVTGSADNGTFTVVRPDSNSYNYINLRLPQGVKPYPAMEFRPISGGQWQQLVSTKIGNDIYESTGINSFGDYALVSLYKTPGNSQALAHKSHSMAGAILASVFAGIIAVMAGLVLLIRRDQKRKNKK